jgi:urease accessory protein
MPAHVTVLSRTTSHTGAMPRMIRAVGDLRARFCAAERGTTLADLFESGGYRLKFPRGESCEAVIVNTGGGMAGGDQLAVTMVVEDNAETVISTQSAEKIYRSDGEPSTIDVFLSLAAGAHCAWLPQETILFAGAQLRRRFTVSMASDARLTVFEGAVFGRVAMGERLTAGSFADRWRIKRAGQLIFAEDVKLSGDIAHHLDRPAVGNGTRAVATFLHIAPDAEALLEGARKALDHASCECGVSAWNGMLIARFASQEPHRLRQTASDFLTEFRKRALPRVWQC